MTEQYLRERDPRFRVVSCGTVATGSDKGKHFCYYEYSDGHTETVINGPAWEEAQKDYKEYLAYLASSKEAKK